MSLEAFIHMDFWLLIYREHRSWAKRHVDPSSITYTADSTKISLHLVTERDQTVKTQNNNTVWV